MARPLRIQFPDAYYHVTCRGNQRQAIFIDSHDEKIFLKILTRSLEIYNVTLLAYVCMSNHFHLLVTTPEATFLQFHYPICFRFAEDLNEYNGKLPTDSCRHRLKKLCIFLDKDARLVGVFY